jgi:hypothetical protein
MSAASSSPAAAAPDVKPSGTSHPRRRGRPPGPAAPRRQDPSDQARRQAALILEVLAGTRTPAAAASALEVAPVRYYQIEARAIDGLIAACEPRSRGRQPLAAEQVASSARVRSLEAECRRLGAEAARLQALLRLNRLSLGVKPPPTPPPATAGKRRPRRASVRALRHARRVTVPTAAAPPKDVAVDTGTPAM